MAVITSDPFLLGDNSFVTKTDGNTSVVTRISKGKALTETEIEEAGDFYNKALGEIDYAEIYNLDFGANFLNKKGKLAICGVNAEVVKSYLNKNKLSKITIVNTNESYDFIIMTNRTIWKDN